MVSRGGRWGARGPKPAATLAGLVALVAFVFAACDGKSTTHPEASAGAGGAPEEPACTATLRRDDEAALPLECLTVHKPVGGGLFRFVLGGTSEDSSLQLWLPSIESGHYTTADCLTAFALFVGDPLEALVASAEVPDSAVSLELVRDGDRLTGSLTGSFCDREGTACRAVTVEDLSIRIDETESDCTCPSLPSDGEWCEVGWCDGTRCTSDRCPAASALCQAF